MLNTSISALLGAFFVVLGALNVWLMFHASKQLRDRPANTVLVRAHRIGGYLFILLFCTMIYFMLLKIREVPDELSVRSLVHMLLALLLFPLLFVKVLIARYYKTYHSVLMPLGIGIFAVAFVLVAMTAGPYVLRRATIRDVSIKSLHLGTRRIDVETAQQLTEKKCGHCHNLDRVFGAQKDARGWLSTINRMRALPGSGISEGDANTILSFLVSENSIDSSTPKGDLAVGKALVDTHCNRCHGLDRAYGTVKNPEEWRATVMRMVVYARGTQGFFKPGDDERIIRFLSTTQSSQAAAMRAAQARSPAAESSGVESPDPARSSQRASSSPGSVLWTTVGVVTALSAMFGTLLLRRPKMSTAGTASVTSDAVAKFEPQKSLVLHLVSIERQARDCATLRFRVPEKQRFNAKPGQFLTFSFLIDGEKFIRSYSICSSPTQVGYVEITAKRKPNGCISVFLNDDAAIGLTVEARGPFGQFYFDERQHQKIVLIAAGSGITPMLSILRYIDDRCLPIEVFLVYSVRTRLDVLFHQELERLQGRLRKFRYLVTLTQPDAEWDGWYGRLNRDLLERNIADIATPTYFLCGPEAFMESAKEILAGIGVAADRIKQERFGGKSSALSTSPDLTSMPATVKFMRSNRTGHIPPGSTLLEAAERCEVPIPSSCRQGQCGTCAVKLLQGQVRMDVEDGLAPEQKSQGYVLTCVGRAVSDVTLDA